MEAHQTQIQLQAQQYNAIYQALRANSSVERPLSIEEVFYSCSANVRGIQQVRDALDSFSKHMPRIVHKLREGRVVRYWINREAPEDRPETKRGARAVTVKEKPLVPAYEIPEITVEKNRIIVSHPRCRVIIELN